ncbi:EF-hand and coiled-coil domain-containing protein 1 isoform X2 [Betta splendens]|uniref:EF-hand and coiled-coil domain-containing protein 1 isoform X2 n=1 Tax=Betta splendens TaxID=158456 RepID=A0A9W2XTT7_BETSP|nr:EF-hand and coiled-coil domain-containing protein 1 isoform X2 [Betta splendens]
MKRTSPAASRVQPTPRAARRSEWLRSALAHHHCPEAGVENEIVVLATGIDQYLQEVFHHLAHTNRNDMVSAEDFTALCDVLGLSGVRKTVETDEDPGEEDEEDDDSRGVCSALPCHLSFKDFHSRLCGYFRVRSARTGAAHCARRMPVSPDTELVEKQIRLRWPRVRSRKCVTFDLGKDQSLAAKRPVNGGTRDDPQADEVWALRELVEDLRSVLQASDARCLALEVALCRERSRTPSSCSRLTSSDPSRTTSITFRAGKLVPTQRIKGQSSGEGARRRDARDPLLRELKLIRSSRDGQLEEAMKFNERLEEEVRWAYQEVRQLQGVEATLRKENAEIRRRAEEAREALSMGLERVRLIQEQAESVPLLRSRIHQLETQMQQYRSCSTCSDSTHPVGAEDTCNRTAEAECLQRAVEGRAASDEEDEDAESCRLRGCVKRCQSHHSKEKEDVITSKDSRGRCCTCRSPSPEQGSNRGGEKTKLPNR